MPLNQLHRSGSNKEKQTLWYLPAGGARHRAGQRLNADWQVLIFARANTGSDEPALLPSRCWGRNPPAAPLHLSFSWGCQRLVRLRRHRQELAAARNLRPERPGRNFPYLHPLTRISSFPGVYFRPLWNRTLSRGISRATAGGSWNLFRLRRPGAALAWAEGGKSSLSPDRFMPFSGRLLGRRSHRDPGDIFHRARFGLCGRRPRRHKNFLVGRLRSGLCRGHPVAPRRGDRALCDFALPRLETPPPTNPAANAHAAATSKRRPVGSRGLGDSAGPLDFAEL